MTPSDIMTIASAIGNLMLIPVAYWALKVDKRLTVIETQITVGHVMLARRHRAGDCVVDGCPFRPKEACDE